MKYEDFKKTICSHLSSPFNDDVINGIWWINKKENKKTSVPHILRMKDYNSKGEQKNEQERVVKEYNLLKIISQSSSKFLLKGKLHRFAHHLNSSQIMCYNFFRPQIDDDKQVKEPLIKLLRDIGVTFNEYHEESEADFEHEDKESKEPKEKPTLISLSRMEKPRFILKSSIRKMGLAHAMMTKKVSIKRNSIITIKPRWKNVASLKRVPSIGTRHFASIIN